MHLIIIFIIFFLTIKAEEPTKADIKEDDWAKFIDMINCCKDKQDLLKLNEQKIQDRLSLLNELELKLKDIDLNKYPELIKLIKSINVLKNDCTKGLDLILSVKKMLLKYNTYLINSILKLNKLNEILITKNDKLNNNVEKIIKRISKNVHFG